MSKFLKVAITFSIMGYLSQQKCFNNSDIKYDLQDPA